MLGLPWGQEATLARTPLVEAAIADGRLTVLDADGQPAPLRGDALDDALRAAELPTTGKVAEKRARLEAHRAEQAEAAAGPGEDEPLGTPAPSGAPTVPVTPLVPPSGVPAGR